MAVFLLVCYTNSAFYEGEEEACQQQKLDC